MKAAFAPIESKDSKVLILGTMPGERSIEINQYYGHKGNQFWKLMFDIFNQPFTFSQCRNVTRASTLRCDLPLRRFNLSR